MLNKFLNYAKQEKLWDENTKVLIGVSGGIDSMVLTHLFLKAGIRPALAHCNFGLRSDESDGDAGLVEEFANNNKLCFHINLFRTEEYANEKGLSIQMAARELRYEWFEQLRIEHNYDCVAIAHNLNDIAETLFINLSRGTGIKGITGIKPRLNSIVRPLLFASREEIELYSQENNVLFREDSTNKTTKYARNKIRHIVIPALKEINPNIENTLLENIHRFHDTQLIYEQAIDSKRKEIAFQKDGLVYFDISKLRKLHPLQPYLYEFLHPYNINKDQIQDIIHALDSQSGKSFQTATHNILRDRHYLIVSPHKQISFERFYIEEHQIEIQKPIHLQINKFTSSKNFEIPRSSTKVCLDIDKLEFPLMIRKWQKGDYFQPLGMKGMKKLSDFFIDQKFSIHQKENTWLLTSNSKIVWLIGHRVDDRFKIANETNNIMELKLIP